MPHQRLVSELTKLSPIILLSTRDQTGVPSAPTSFQYIQALAKAKGSAADLKGICRGGQTHKLALYADDLILYLSQTEFNPQSS